MESKLGKIKVYGKIIDLDEMPVENLRQVNEILYKRLDQLCDKYIELYENMF